MALTGESPPAGPRGAIAPAADIWGMAHYHVLGSEGSWVRRGQSPARSTAPYIGGDVDQGDRSLRPDVETLGRSVYRPSGSAEWFSRGIAAPALPGVPVTIEHRPATPSPEDMTGLDLAYGFVQPSYQWVLARFEAGNTRLQTLQAIVASVSLAVPAFAKLLDESLSFTDWRFVAAVIVFLAAMAVGVVGRQTGTVRLVRPKELLDIDWLMLSEARFKVQRPALGRQALRPHRRGRRNEVALCVDLARPIPRRARPILQLDAGA